MNACRAVPRRRPLRRAAALAALAAAWLLQGCAGVATAPTAPTLPGAPAATTSPAAPRPATLAVERQWLQSWFDGTPVRIEQRSERVFDIEVPREFCFDAGRSGIKPPLAAVLDKLVLSLQRKPELRVDLLAAPGDAAGSAPLALRRAGEVRQYLMSRGVAEPRLAQPGVAGAAAVQLRIGLAAP
ncbi:MAG TPA: hypothetical protein PLB41_13105 [Rubrivivax sp.]|nr:hypothetical protein [Rubrivivax sp.]